jgi:hypothetical protein
MVKAPGGLLLCQEVPVKDEFKRASVTATACCWSCDKPKGGGDKTGLRQVFHQIARTRMRREAKILFAEELGFSHNRG